jgi:hypothetical protein
MDIQITPQIETRAFLKLLDPAAKEFHFRTFDDKKDIDRSGLTGNVSGPIDQVEPKLLARNAAGAGVFVVINDGGQKKDYIKRIRAVFADTDGAPLEPIINALDPHAVIESSPGNFHVYYLVAEDFPLMMFTPIQEAISAKFGTDPNVKDLPRVMRMPGFKHNKYDPVDVKFQSLDRNLGLYTAGEVINGLGLNLKSQHPTHTSINSPLARALRCNPYSLIDAEGMLRFIDPSCNRDKWIRICFAIVEEYGEEGRDLFIRWSRGDLMQGAVK